MNKILNNRFDEPFYKGQDVVNYGIRIPLRDDNLHLNQIVAKFSRNAQRIIENRDKTIVYEDLKTEHLRALKDIWFDPKDPDFIEKMTREHTGIVAFKDNQLVGGVIWTASGTGLFLHNLVSNKKGKSLGIPTLLIYRSIIKYFKLCFSLDIGVSYNPKRMTFFENFGVQRYLIILKAPFLPPVIRFSPFQNAIKPDFKQFQNIKEQGGVQNSTFFPRASYALYGLLKHLDLKPTDNVVIYKTFKDNNYVSACIIQMIEKVCQYKINEKIDVNTKLVLVIHEFGIKCELSDIFLKTCNVPIVEDCVWTNQQYYKESAYRIYSTSKVVDLPFGGYLVGAKLTDEFLWSIGCLDVYKRDYVEQRFHHTMTSEQNKIHLQRLWMMYHKMMSSNGFMTDKHFDYSGMLTEGWIPRVFFHQMQNEKECKELVARFEEFGIESGIYHGTNMVFTPIHFNLTPEDMEYIFAVFTGYYNLCRNYKGGIIQ